jgi:two-component system, cell cycle response regulator
VKLVAERTGRPTLNAMATPSSRLTTEQVEIVGPGADHTVTVTETAPSFLEALDDEASRATLVLVAGPEPGQVFSLGTDMVIGRDATADIRVDDPAVSRMHIRMYIDDGNYAIEDLGSVNGTLVNGTRVSRRHLVDGDRIQLGSRVILKFSLLHEAEERLQRQLFESATRDPLTQAYNKKYITERLAAEVAHARRHSSALELVIFDLDRFKQINDVHGHLVGDTVLRAVADRVHSLVRTEDVFGRFGGEEFVLVSRGADAVKLAERIRAAIETLTIPANHGQLRVTVSIGVARLDEVGFDTSGIRLIEVADHRLLRAKRSGRNQVCAHD